jgi:hypothetical protein
MKQTQHVARMGYKITVQMDLVVKPEGSRQLGRPRCRGYE